jgi:hypothetical protein
VSIARPRLRQFWLNKYEPTAASVNNNTSVQQFAAVVLQIVLKFCSPRQILALENSACGSYSTTDEEGFDARSVD